MTILTGRRWLKFLLDKPQNAVDVPDECFAFNDSCHTANAEKALATVFVVRLPDVADYTDDGVLEHLPVTSEDVFDVFIHYGYQLDTLFLDEGIPGVLI